MIAYPCRSGITRYWSENYTSSSSVMLWNAFKMAVGNMKKIVQYSNCIEIDSSRTQKWYIDNSISDIHKKWLPIKIDHSMLLQTKKKYGRLAGRLHALQDHIIIDPSDNYPNQGEETLGSLHPFILKLYTVSPQ